MGNLTAEQLEKEFWIYDAETDSPRIATLSDFNDMKTFQSAVIMHKWIIKELLCHRPGEPNDYRKWVQSLRDAVAPLIAKDGNATNG